MFTTVYNISITGEKNKHCSRRETFQLFLSVENDQITAPFTQKSGFQLKDI